MSTTYTLKELPIDREGGTAKFWSVGGARFAWFPANMFAISTPCTDPAAVERTVTLKATEEFTWSADGEADIDAFLAADYAVDDTLTIGY